MVLAGDGITNLMKYALNLNPWMPATGSLPIPGTVTVSNVKYLTLAYTQTTAATDISYIVEVSGDLRTWNSGTNYTSLVSETNTSGAATQTATVRDQIPLTGTSRRFIRLKVTGP